MKAKSDRGRRALFKNVFKDTGRRFRVFLKVWPQILNLVDLAKIGLCELFGLRTELALRPRDLRHTFLIRTLTTDVDVLRYVLSDKYHLPPDRFLMPACSTILDLGSNIGLTLAHLKSLYPKARIVGYEMDRDNYLLAKKNIREYQNVSLYNKAVWTQDVELEYPRATNPDSHSLEGRGTTTGQTVKIQGVSMATILKENQLDEIHFLKMDIEGAERAIFESTDLDWLEKVHALNLEVHFRKAEREEKIEAYLQLLRSHGFDAWRDARHWASILAVKANANPS